MAAIRTSVQFKLNTAELRRLSGPSGMVGRMTRPTAEGVAQRARQAAPVDSGAYRDSIRVLGPREGPSGPTCSIASSSPYALAIDFKQRPVLREAIRNATVIV